MTHDHAIEAATTAAAEQALAATDTMLATWLAQIGFISLDYQAALAWYRVDHLHE